MSLEMEKAYEPQNVERRIYQLWLERGVCDAEVNPAKPSYCIVIPPPNVTGVLHIGHALDNTVQDLLIRWKRMCGFEALWVPGTDHAGIATQNVVERMLAQEGLSRHDLGREAFVERVWEVKHKHHARIVEQLQRLGCSLDWRRERFTMDEGLSRAVREAFVTLWERGLIYRGDYMVNWCPRCATGLSDLEVEDSQVTGHLWHIRYPATDGGPGVVVATTRPETMLGDTAVAVHPDDERYRDLVGKTVLLPLMEREIPVVADAHVDRDFGTGAVKVTPAHDPDDLAIAGRHNLPEVLVIGRDGKMTEAARQYAGLDRYDCRAQVVADLEERGLLEAVQEYAHILPRCSRCESVLEPLVSTQWFVRMKPLAEKGLAAVEQGTSPGLVPQVRFVPPRWTKVYRDWLENIRDWPISRQLWWGHPIPVWYCDACGEMTCAREDPTRCAHCGGESLRQDEDVLDTWFSSQLWPFSTLGWPDQTPEVEYFYPTSVLVTAYDIIFFWVARMIMAGLELRNEIPFRDVFIHGLVRDEKGRKISKSLGTSIDPIQVIDQYGADALRFALTQLITHGQDLSLAEDRFVGARNFCNKLWNASRFVLMNLQEASGARQSCLADSLADRWILSRQAQTLQAVISQLEEYNLAQAADALYAYVWSEFCDWYVELAKPALHADDPARQAHARAMLAGLLSNILRALHPFMPFITEEIWQRWQPESGPLALQPYPTPQAEHLDAEAEAQMQVVMEVVNAARSLRADFGVTPGARAALTVIAPDPATRDRLQAQAAAFHWLAYASEVSFLVAPAPKPAGAVSAVAGATEVYLHLSGAVDVEAELARLEKQLAKSEADADRSRKKLSNEGFISKARPEVIQREREILAGVEAAIAKMTAQRASLEALR